MNNEALAIAATPRTMGVAHRETGIAKRFVTVVLVYVSCCPCVGAFDRWIDLNPPPSRREFVSDTRFEINDWKPTAWASFNDRFFVFVTKRARISFDMATGKTKFSGNYKPDAAAREFWKLLESQAKQAREREQNEAVNKATLKLLEPISKALKGETKP